MPGPFDFLSRWRRGRAERRYVMMLNGQVPVFSQFGENIYASDVVQWCIGYIAGEISKCRPRHIRMDGDNNYQVVSGPINRMLRISPNSIMTTKDFLEKTVWLLYLNYNCFIYPVYDEVVDDRGRIKKVYREMYPLAPRQVDFVTAPDGTLCVCMLFGNGESYTVEYADLIHLRLKYSVNEFMGGNTQGQPDTGPLLNTLKINHDLLQMLPQAVKTSLGARVNIRINTMLDTEQRKNERDKFVEAIEDGRGGVLVTDLTDSITPLNIDPKLIDRDTMEFLEQKILRWYGLSMPVISGDFTDEQYQAVYEKTLEPLIIGMGQAYSKTLFTVHELDRGNEIAFYPQSLLYSNTKNKIAVADILGNRGALTDNELLAMFGYPPFEGGERRQKSLNFINRDIADEYQLLMAQRNRKGGSILADIQTSDGNRNGADDKPGGP